MSKYLKIAVVLVFGLTAAACGENRNQTIGTIAGAAAGAAVGSTIGQGSGRTAAMIVGAAIGAYIGSELGRRLDERDRRIAQQNANYAMKETQTGTTSKWENPDSGNRGELTPTTDPYRNNEGRTCRDFTETIELADGESDTVSGTRCQRADGSWEVVSVS